MSALPLSPLTLDELLDRRNAALQHAGGLVAVIASGDRKITDDDQAELLARGDQSNALLDAIRARLT